MGCTLFFVSVCLLLIIFDKNKKIKFLDNMIKNLEEENEELKELLSNNGFELIKESEKSASPAGENVIKTELPQDPSKPAKTELPRLLTKPEQLGSQDLTNIAKAEIIQGLTKPDKTETAFSQSANTAQNKAALSNSDIQPDSRSQKNNVFNAQTKKTKESTQKSLPKRRVHTASNTGPAVALALGAVFIVLSGIVFATTTWSILPSAAKIISILLFAAVFFISSYIAHDRLKIVQTAKAFYILGALYLFVAIIAVGYFKLFGEYFSVFGEGRYYLYFLGMLLSEIAFLFGLKIFREKWYAFICLSGIDICFLLICYAFDSQIGSLSTAFAVFACITVYIDIFFKNIRLPKSAHIMRTVFKPYARMNLITALISCTLFSGIGVLPASATALIAITILLMLQLSEITGFKFIYSAASLLLLVIAVFRYKHIANIESVTLRFMLIDIICIVTGYLHRLKKTIRDTFDICGLFNAAIIYLLSVFSAAYIMNYGNSGKIYIINNRYIIITAMLLVTVHTVLAHYKYLKGKMNIPFAVVTYSMIYVLNNDLALSAIIFTVLQALIYIIQQLLERSNKAYIPSGIADFFAGYSMWNITVNAATAALFLENTYINIIPFIFIWTAALIFSNRMKLADDRYAMAFISVLYLGVGAVKFTEGDEQILILLIILTFTTGTVALSKRLSAEVRSVYKYSSFFICAILYIMGLYLKLMGSYSIALLIAAFFTVLLYVSFAEIRYFKPKTFVLHSAALFTLIYVLTDNIRASSIILSVYMLIIFGIRLLENSSLTGVNQLQRYIGLYSRLNLLLCAGLTVITFKALLADAVITLLYAAMFTVYLQKTEYLSDIEKRLCLYLSVFFIVLGVYRLKFIGNIWTVNMALTTIDIIFVIISSITVLKAKIRDSYKIFSFISLTLLYLYSAFIMSELFYKTSLHTVAAMLVVWLHTCLICFKYFQRKIGVLHGIATISLLYALFFYIDLGNDLILSISATFSLVLIIIRNRQKLVVFTKEAEVFYLVNALLLTVQSYVLALSGKTLLYYTAAADIILLIIIKREFMRQFSYLKYINHILESAVLILLTICLQNEYGVNIDIKIFLFAYLSLYAVYNCIKNYDIDINLIVLMTVSAFIKYDWNSITLPFLITAGIYIFVKNYIQKNMSKRWAVLSLILINTGQWMQLDYFGINAVVILYTVFVLDFALRRLYIYLFTRKLADVYFKLMLSALLILCLFFNIFIYQDLHYLIISEILMLVFYLNMYFEKERVYALISSALILPAHLLINNFYYYNGTAIFIVTLVALLLINTAARVKRPIIIFDGRNSLIDFLGIFSILYPAFSLPALDERFYCIFFIAAAVYILQYRCINRLREHCVMAASVFVLTAYFTQKFVVFPQLIRAEMYVGGFALLVFALKYIYSRAEARFIAKLQNIAYIACLLILALDAVISYDMPNAILTEAIYITAFIISAAFKNKIMRRAAFGFALALVLYMTKVFWIQMGWWLGLLAGGISLMAFAATSERRKRKHKEDKNQDIDN